MKKFLFALMCLIVLNFTTTEARIDDSRIALGGIIPGSRLSDVIAMYGEPDEKVVSDRWTYKSYVYYGTGKNRVVLEMYGVGLSYKGTEGVRTIGVESDNGFATPDGIKVGTPAAMLVEKYGEPDFKPKDFVSGTYYYGFLYYFRFGITNGKISSIHAGCQGDYAWKKTDPKFWAMALATDHIEVPHW